MLTHKVDGVRSGRVDPDRVATAVVHAALRRLRGARTALAPGTVRGLRVLASALGL